MLEAIFGDQAVRTLAERARQDLLERVAALFDEEAGRYRSALDGAGIDDDFAGRLRAASTAVQLARADVRLDPQ